MTTQEKNRPTATSPARLRANRERAQAAAMAELAIERNAAGMRSQKLRELRLARERKEMILAAAAKHAAKKAS